ncbi:hypothetical protein QYE76_060218 [Lolium multiflorum]|uniref:CCHC-type domain-containing protein n=1 Tax=Lolium multiflorum TaxID=4521 RepID=A0AAD8S014_LOLMU|nr:hypothetical protein QYE76_060218 [Lolium multiflorum]
MTAVAAASEMFPATSSAGERVADSAPASLPAGVGRLYCCGTPPLLHLVELHQHLTVVSFFVTVSFHGHASKVRSHTAHERMTSSGDRHQGHHKDYLDACLEGSFTSKEVEARWDLLERIQSNTEDWDNDKGKESGYVEKPPFKPLPPKEGNEEKEKKKKKGTKKKKKRGNKKKEVSRISVSSPVPPGAAVGQSGTQPGPPGAAAGKIGSQPGVPGAATGLPRGTRAQELPAVSPVHRVLLPGNSVASPVHRVMLPGSPVYGPVPPEFHSFLRDDMKCKSSHDIWTKIRGAFGKSMNHMAGGISEELSSPSHHEELQVASTSGRDILSSSSTSPTCGKTQEEIEQSMRHETLMNEDSKTSSSSSSDMHMCLMAKGPKVTPTLDPNTSSNDDSDDDDENSMLKELFYVRCTLRGDALVKFDYLMDSLKERNESIEELESHIENEERGFNLLRQELKNESTCISTNHVEEIEELKAQVLSLKKDLEKRHEGKSALDKMLSVQQSPNDKSGLGFNSNNKNKSKRKSNKKKVQDKVKDPAKLVCFKCKVKGHHVRSCPLKKKKHLSEKQQGKRPQGQGQAQAQPQVEDRPLPKKNQDIVPQEKKSIKKRKGNTCYLCREKGHLASSCLSGTLSNPIIVDDDYSLGKDKDGNVFAKFVGTQSGFKKRTIWVAKPIVTNLLGPNLVGDQQAQT